MCHQLDMMNKKHCQRVADLLNTLGGFLQFPCIQLRFFLVSLNDRQIVFLYLFFLQTKQNVDPKLFSHVPFFFGEGYRQGTSSTKLPNLHWRSCHNLSWSSVSGYDPLKAFTSTSTIQILGISLGSWRFHGKYGHQYEFVYENGIHRYTNT